MPSNYILQMSVKVKKCNYMDFTLNSPYSILTACTTIKYNIRQLEDKCILSYCYTSAENPPRVLMARCFIETLVNNTCVIASICVASWLTALLLTALVC